jgi:hypothetical protein
MAAGWIVRAASTLLPADKKPVFLYVRDFFTSRLTYVPHVAVDIGSVWETKLAALGAHESQVFEANPKRQGILEEVQASKEKQREVLFLNAYSSSHITPDNFLTLSKWYGPAAAEKVTYVEAFEVAEYGRQLREPELRELMPMTGKVVTLPGRTAWLDTGIDVTRGKPIQISATGRIQWNSNGRLTCPPTGAVPYTRFGNKPMQGVNTGAIIGKVGQDSTDYFYIGNGDQILPFSTGRLFVGINDDNVTDNAGYYRLWFSQVNDK